MRDDPSCFITFRASDLITPCRCCDIVFDMALNIDQKLDALTAALEAGFAAVAGDLADLRQDVRDVREDVNDGMRSLRSDVARLHKRLDAIEAAVGNHTGYRKEIDYLLERLADVEMSPRHQSQDRGVIAGTGFERSQTFAVPQCSQLFPCVSQCFDIFNNGHSTIFIAFEIE